MQQYPLGEIVIQRVVESVCKDFAPLGFFPETTPEDWAQHRKWMEPRALDPVSGNLVLIIQAFLVRTRHHTILIDSCAGNHKSRPGALRFHQLNLPFFEELAAAGLSPEPVDFVMCIYLHVDNCRLRPLGSDLAWYRGEAGSQHRVYEDSVLPVIKSGQAETVEGEGAVGDGLMFHPPGHTVGHAAQRF